MICSPRLFEIVLDCSAEKIQKLMDKAYGNLEIVYGNLGTNLDKSCSDVHIDTTLMDRGIKIEYHDGTYKKKVKFTVNPTVLLGGDDAVRLWKPNDENISKLLYRLEKNIGKYFNYKYSLNDFKLTRVDFAVNTDVGSRKTVSAYLRVLRNIGRVKGFSPKRGKGDGCILDGSGFDVADSFGFDSDSIFDFYSASSSGFDLRDGTCFCLKGNSNGIEFMVYDMKAAYGQKKLESEIIYADSGGSKGKYNGSKRGGSKGMLRIEVRLMKSGAIRRYTGETEAPGQITCMSVNCQEIFFQTFVHVVPYGDYYKKNDAVRIIEENVPDRKTRVKMLGLLELIPKKKSLLLAQKAMNDRNIGKVMKMFEQLNLSPVTISKRHDVKYLDTLYAYLFRG